MNYARITAAVLAATLTLAQFAAPGSLLQPDSTDTALCALAAQTTSGTYGAQITWRLESGVLTIDGTGKMADETTVPWLAFAEGINAVVIEEGVTGIADGAFIGCENLVDVSLPASLELIGARAFANCTRLDTIIVDHNVASLGEAAFENCTALKRVGIGRGVPAIAPNTFHGCTALELVSLTGGMLEVICADAFAGCTMLEQFIVPAGVSTISARAFTDCTGLRALYLPASVNMVADDALRGCDPNLIVYCPGNAEVSSLINDEDFVCIDLKTEIDTGKTLTALSGSPTGVCFDFSSLSEADAVTEIAVDLLTDSGICFMIDDPGATRVDFSVAAQITDYRTKLAEPLYAGNASCTFSLSADAPLQTNCKGFSCVNNIHFFNKDGVEVFPTNIYRVEKLRGDVNGDAWVDVNDAVAILKDVSAMLLGSPSQLTPLEMDAADINRNGKIEIVDAVRVLKYYAANLLRPTDWDEI